MKKLLENHDFLIRFKKLAEQAENIGISISFDNTHSRVTVTDTINNKSYIVSDLESAEVPISHFPPLYDYKILITDD